jgi:PAS domain S-box-containing protein
VKTLSKLKIFFIIAATSFVLFLLAFYYYKSESGQIIKEKHEFLDAVTKIKLDQVADWKKERLSNAQFLPTIGKFIKYTSNLNSNINDFEAREYFSNVLLKFKENGYYENVLITDMNGKILFDLDTGYTTIDEERLEEINSAVQKDSVVFGDFFNDEGSKKILFNIISVIKYNDGVPIGALVQQVDPNKSLFALIKKWPTLSKSIETLIFKRETDNILYLSELRHKKNSALSLKISLSDTNVVAIKAVLGASGILEGKDYRGVNVVAAVKKVPGTDWFMVSKMDKVELNSELFYRAGIISLVALFTILLTTLAALYIYKLQQSSIYKNLFLKEKELSETQEEYRTTLYSIGDAVITTDTHGEIKQMNSAAETLTGWLEKEVKGQNLRTVFRIINEDTTESVENPVDRILREGVIVGLANHTLLISKNGTQVPIADSGSPIKNSDGKITGVVLVFRDQTEERINEKALQESNEKFSKIFKHSSDSITLTQLSTGKLFELNDGFEKMFGYTREEVIGKTTFELGLWANQNDRIKILEMINLNSYVTNFEAVGIQKNGNHIIALISGEFVELNNEKFLLLSLKDITERKRAESELQRSNDLLRAIIEAAPTAIFDLDLDGNVKAVWNPAAEKILGWSAKEVIGRPLPTVNRDKQEEFKGFRERIRSGKTVDGIEVNRQKKDGTPIDYCIYASPLYDAEGSVIGNVAVLMDITERKRVEEIIKSSEANLNSLINNRNESIWSIDKDYNFIVINDFFSETFFNTYNKKLTKGSNAIELLLPELKTFWKPKYDEALSGKKIEFEFSHILNNQVQYFQVFLNPIISDGIISGVSALSVDITERKQMEDELAARGIELINLADSSPGLMGTFYLRPDGSVCMPYSSPQIQDLFGLSSEDVVDDATPLLTRTHPDDALRVNESIAESARTMTPWRCEYRVLHPTRGELWLEGSTNPKPHPNGGVIWYGFVHDITERRNAEKALQVSEELYRTLINTSPDAVAVTDPTGVITFISNKSLEIFGNSSIQEVLGHNILEWVAPQDREKAGRNFKYLTDGEGQKDKEYLLLKKNGSIFWGEINAAPVYGTDGKLQSIIIVTRDISIRKRTEESVRKLSHAVEQSPATILITDVKGNIEYVNPKFLEVTGYTFEEVKGKNPRILKSGTMSPDNYKQMWNDIVAGKEWHGEFHNKKKNGEYYWESASISPIFNSKDEITNFLAIKQDITEQKRMTSELVEAKEKAEEMNKVKTYFFANMSHELRTPFVGIMGFSELLAETLINPEEKKYAEQILKSSKRLTDTLNKILNVAKIEFDGIEISNSDLSVDKTVGEITALYTQSAKVNNTELITDLKFGSSKIRSDKELLEEILDNLISNAVKYTKNGRVVVSSEKTKEDEKVYLILKVADTGVGIPEEMQKVVWREFRQASEGFNRSFEGTGLGLTITKKYVDKLNGIISLVSEEGKGTLFTIKLPVTFASKDKVKVEKLFKHTTKVDTDINKPKYKVLYVEDDAIALQYITIVLKSLYDIETTLTAKSALDLINKNQYDVVMLDINLGRGMDGVQLMQEIKKIELYKGIPFVAVTAYAAESDKAEFFAKGFSHYISKPFSSNELKELLAKIVEELNNQID